MKIILLFLFALTLNAQTWNSSTSTLSTDIHSKLHSETEQLMSLDSHDGHFILNESTNTWTKVANDYGFSAYPFLSSVYNTSPALYGSSYGLEALADGLYFFWGSNYLATGPYDGRLTRVRVLNSSLQRVSEYTYNLLDGMYGAAYSESAIAKTGSIYDTLIIAQRRPGNQSYNTTTGFNVTNDYSLLREIIYNKSDSTFSAYDYNSITSLIINLDPDTVYVEFYPILQIFENSNSQYCITGTRVQYYPQYNMNTQADILPGVVLRIKQGTWNSLIIVKEWTDIKYAQFVNADDERTYFILENPDNLSASSRGVWKLYRGVLKQLSRPYDMPSASLFTGLYCIQNNIFLATSNGVDNTENYLYQYWKGQWTRKYELPYLTTEMVYYHNKFFAKYRVTRQHTYPNTSGTSDPAPKWTEDVNIINDESYFFIGIK